MALSLSNAIRRAASRAVPLAIRASAGSRRYLHHQRSALLAAVNRPSGHILQRSVPSFLHCYSSKPKSDASLLRAIQTEIQCAEESEDSDEDEEVPEGFPFEIEDHPGQQTAITLRREYQGETITVEVSMLEVDVGEDDEEDENNDEEGKENQWSIPLVVRVSKKSVSSLEFGCTAYPDEISIDSLAIKDPETSEDQIASEGPDFGDVDENLQKAFYKYLETRGIKPSTTNFLRGYMLHKDRKAYIAWLENLHKFVQT